MAWAGPAKAGPRLDAAVLDVTLRGKTASPLADRLLALGVPFVLATGYGDADVPARPARPAHVPGLDKPVNAARVVRAAKPSIEPALQGRTACDATLSPKRHLVPDGTASTWLNCSNHGLGTVAAE